ncbi:protein spaetzle 4 [Aedes albopictus]|uniref:Spaetzle domain-containing protein n=1 Tax=Aedes albopictus TaxID=7160 RepID=A0ABM1YS35_AEDAL
MNQQKRAEVLLFHFLILVTLIPILTTNGLGYDSASSCDPNVSRKGRSAQLIQTIPCDLSIQAYCNLPGTSYPWHAVRRFVHENQGLMRRMYGDIRHISVLKEEIDDNEIYLDDIQHTAEKYSRLNAGKKVKHLYSPHHEYNREKVNDILTEPHFRPTQKTTTTTAASTTTTATTTTTTSVPPTSSASTTETHTAKPSSSTPTITSAKFVPIKTTSKPTFLNITLNNIKTDTTESTAKQNKTKIVMNTVNGSSIDIEKLSTIAILETNETLLGNLTITERHENKVSNLTVPTENNDIPDDASTPSYSTTETTNNGDKPPEDVVDTSKENMISNMPERNTTTKDSVKNSKPTSGQLFQDVAQKEQPPVGVKGVNACPVKEEVVAPFWANNTRGEVLALLNLYPFEQYVHWEKCAYELKQMYCREGCRCEQQYRLHRLLAYDPHNECRGIFSDWFRFPSCCICKCYDIPFDFRVTSRSPRTINKESIQIVEDELQNAIYDHAADEWYRPKNNDGF